MCAKTWQLRTEDGGSGRRVKLPEHALIPDDKLRRYLLLPREENDKSAFLALAGDTLATWEVLKQDLHELMKVHAVTDTISSPYGIKHEIHGALTGPNGQIFM